MKPQEVITIIVPMSEDKLKENVVKIYPELDQFFDKGMYIEKVVQNCLENRNCAITFVFRYYNTFQSKVD